MNPNITAARIVRLFEKHKVEPIRHAFVKKDARGRKCGCAVGIEVIDRMGFANALGVIWGYIDELKEISGYSREFCDGISWGWEGAPLDRVSARIEDYEKGYRIGARAWKSCVAKGLVKS